MSTPGKAFVIGEQIYTPTGSIAEVLVIYPDVGEALVVWPWLGTRARFRLSLLRHVPAGAIDQRIPPDFT